MTPRRPQASQPTAPPPGTFSQPPQAAPAWQATASGVLIPPSLTPPTTVGTESGIAAFGTMIQVLSSVGPPEGFTTIAGVGDITGPNTSSAETETTSHSTGTAHRTFIPTLIDDGDISFPCYFNPSDPTHSLYSPYGLENLFQNRAVTRWRLVNTDPAHRTREFSGYVNKLGEKYPVAGVCTRDTTIRITSVPTDVAAVVTLNPTTDTAQTATGGTATITVTSTDTMAWTATPFASWITVTSPTQPVTGNGAVDYTVAANATGASRTSFIMIGNQQFTITQAG